MPNSAGWRGLVPLVDRREHRSGFQGGLIGRSAPLFVGGGRRLLPVTTRYYPETIGKH